MVLTGIGVVICNLVFPQIREAVGVPYTYVGFLLIGIGVIAIFARALISYYLRSAKFY